MESSIKDTPYHPEIKSVFTNTFLGRATTLMLTGLALSGIYHIANTYVSKIQPEPLVQKQVIGADKPDIFIERDGVRYYSHVDGKDISNLVR